MGHSRNGHLCPQTKPYVCIYMCILNHAHTHIILSGFLVLCKEVTMLPNTVDSVHKCAELGSSVRCVQSGEGHTYSDRKHVASLNSVHRERGKSQRTTLAKGPRVWKAAAAISLKWPLTHGLIKLNALAQKCRWMS